jgi:TAT (twin-arginine translocation) pathway signal sequence
MITRRQFLKASGLAGAGLLIPWKGKAFAVPIRGGSLDLSSILKYQSPLVIPPAMPKTGRIGRADYYEIAVRQFQQQILPLGMPPTTVWSYGSVNHPGTFNYPAFTIEANYHIPVRVKWRSQLVRLQRQLPPAPPAGGPDTPLGQPARGEPLAGICAPRSQVRLGLIPVRFRS